MTAATAGKRNVFKFPIYFMPDVFHKVFPFHMAKGMQAMRGMVKNCDCIIEVRDARVPLSSFNEEFEYLYANKPRLVLMNKIDLADKEKTKRICEQHLTKENTVDVLFTNCKSDKNAAIRRMMSLLKDVFKKRNQDISTQKSKPIVGLNEGQYKVLICGIPNVGKSSLINRTRRVFTSKGGKATRVGKNPGVTRSVLQSIIISEKPRVTILDTPGIISPKLDDNITGIKLALTGTFPDHMIGEEVIADYLLFALNQQNNTSYLNFCGLEEASDDFDEVVTQVSKKYELMKSGEPDYRRSSILLINAFRRNKFGNVTLDDVT